MAVLEQAPALYEGQRIDQSTFHRLYKATQEGFRAELIGGIVHIMSPAGEEHSGSHGEVSGWLLVFKAASPGVRAHVTPTVILGLSDEPEPDACLRILPSHGGMTRIEEGCIAGPPELVVEVGVSSAKLDLNRKKSRYEALGVQEYVVVAPTRGQLHWFLLQNGRYETIPSDEDGILRSRIFPGLWLDPAALLTGNTARVLQVLQQGVDSEEHQQWAAKLQAFGKEHE
ncbi:MAG TPA: Uma2 family endonuclease [Armatimonadota bacterium]|nr:Uma2 family endonuclease [Armatimonadota bacterium]